MIPEKLLLRIQTLMPYLASVSYTHLDVYKRQLNIRRSAAWGNDTICGRAIRGQSYYVKEIHVVDGKKMVRTIGELYLSGESEHVQFEQL